MSSDVEVLAEALNAIGYGDLDENFIPADWLLSYLPAGWRLTNEAADNPEYDGTDAAHPAWWRGSDYATKVLTAEIERLRAALAEVERRQRVASGNHRDDEGYHDGKIDAALPATEDKQ